MYKHVQLTTCVHKSDLRKTRLFAELRKVSSSVTSATVCTITMTVGETSDDVRTVDRPIIEFIVLYNRKLEKACYLESIANRLFKNAFYMGSVRTAQGDTHNYYYYYYRNGDNYFIWFIFCSAYKILYIFKYRVSQISVSSIFVTESGIDLLLF